MKSNCIISIHEIVKILEPKPINFACIIPFFNFSIGMRMIDARLNVFDLIFFKKIFKPAIFLAFLISLIGKEASSSIC